MIANKIKNSLSFSKARPSHLDYYQKNGVFFLYDVGVTPHADGSILICDPSVDVLHLQAQARKGELDVVIVVGNSSMIKNRLSDMLLCMEVESWKKGIEVAAAMQDIKCDVLVAPSEVYEFEFDAFIAQMDIQ